MKETSKCYNFRLNNNEFSSYLHGHGIDIGAGNDPLVLPDMVEGSVRSWDVNDGDAQVMEGVVSETYDFVYSSHCLEHMRDVPEALASWIRILKPSGFLYTVVPDYLFYEKGCWPSMFNSDHKQTFSDKIERSWVCRPNHWHVEQDLKPLLQSLGANLVHSYMQLENLNWNQLMRVDHTLRDGITHLVFICQKNAS
jgi:predicted SAM-dependent methyltransferase